MGLRFPLGGAESVLNFCSWNRPDKVDVIEVRMGCINTAEGEMGGLQKLEQTEGWP